MTLLDLLKNKKVRVMSDLKVPVELVIREVKANNRYIETGPSNAANDWYPDGYYEISYSVIFTNGVVKSYSNLAELEILPD